MGHHTIKIGNANYVDQWRMKTPFPCLTSHLHVTKVVPRQFQIRHTTNCFTEEGEVDGTMVIDEETARWPVPPQLRDELNKIKFEYRAVPLPIYVNGRFVEPADVNNTIKGALVELHFELHHFAIRKVMQDSFNATIEQIIVLRPGEACPMTVYKRKNPRDGPIRVKPTILPRKQAGEASAKTDESAADKENEVPSMAAKRRRQKAKESEDGAKAPMSEK